MLMANAIMLKCLFCQSWHADAELIEKEMQQNQADFFACYLIHNMWLFA